MRTGETYVYELMKTGLRILFEKRMGYYAARPLLVYHIQRIEDGYIPLNRDYKPLGLMGGGWADYNKFKFLTLPENEIVFHKGLQENCFLFGDATTPFDKAKRLIYQENLINAFPKLNEKHDLDQI